MNDDPIVSCPFNMNHKFKKSKLMAHIHRCGEKKRLGKNEIITCRANVLCQFHVSKQLEHEANCKACAAGEELEPNLLLNSNYTQFEETQSETRINLSNINESTLIFDANKLFSSEQFYSIKPSDKDKTILAGKEENTIIY
jgi:hypothetical protein